MPYLICDQCGACYELEEGESADDFDLNCECGGHLKHTDSIPLKKIISTVLEKWKEIGIVMYLSF